MVQSDTCLESRCQYVSPYGIFTKDHVKLRNYLPDKTFDEGVCLQKPIWHGAGEPGQTETIAPHVVTPYLHCQVIHSDGINNVE